MSPFVIGNIQFTLSLIIYTLIMLWYIWPGARLKPWREAVIPLLFIHAFRYGPLTLLMPGQVDSALPIAVKETIAYGDFLSGILAILAILMVRYRMSGDKVTVWIFTIVGLLDVAVASFTGIQAGALDLYMGFNLYILNFYVPMLIVSHITIIKLLLNNNEEK